VTWVKVAAADALPPGLTLRVQAGGRDLALHNVDGTVYCTSNTCPHQGRPIDGGTLEGPHLVCPWHAWVFDVKTGLSPFNPYARIPCFPVKVEAGAIFVAV
jgi:nitrite reductase (NADH) small subunit